MIKELNENTALKFKSLNEEEKKSRGILGRLYGPVASCVVPTRNGRKYTQDLWEKLFESDLIKERFANGGICGQLCHPDYSEVDIEKIACIMPEPPVKDKDGNLIAYVDLVDTPCGRIAYQLAKYGYKFGISSRGEGDLIEGPDGEEVDPDTYQLNAWDLVEIPANENARLVFTESLDKKRYNKTLRQTLQESIDKATDEDKVIMNEALDNLGINLKEDSLDDVGVSKAKAKLISQKRANDKFKCAGHEILGKDLLDYFEPDEELTISHDNVIVSRKNEALDYEVIDTYHDSSRKFEIIKNTNGSVKPYEVLCGNKSLGKFNSSAEAEEWLFDNYSLAELDEGILDKEDRYKDWDPADAELHRNTDWKARNYEDLPVPEDSFEDDVVMYNYGGEPEHKNVKFIKRLRSNPIFPPYYAPEEKPFEHGLGAMYDGKRHGKYDIHNRYEDQETYDRLSESRKACGERLISTLRDSQGIDESKESVKHSISELRDYLDAWYSDNLANENANDTEAGGWDEDIQQAYLNFRNSISDIEGESLDIKESTNGSVEDYLGQMKKGDADKVYRDAKGNPNAEKAYKIYKDIKDENLNINESAEEVVNDKSSGLVAELQEALLKVKELEDDNLSLQEKLSVCNAKENQLQEQLDKYKKATINLSESAKQVKSLNEDKEKLTEDLNKQSESASRNKARINSLIDTKKDLITQLTEAKANVEELNNQITSINEKLDENSKQLERSNQLVEKYRKNYATLKESYLEVKAANYGIDKSELKTNLKESYTLNDVDSLCEELAEKKSKLNKLPFVINENTNISFKKSSNEYIMNESLANNSDDYVSDSLLQLANLK